MELKKGYKKLLEEADAKITTLSLDEAKAKLGNDDVVFVDLRDARELEREGMVPGAFHATRGMLEFWVDPESPYYKDIFGSGKEFVLYCAGGWRSALAAATMVDMGFDRVAHVDGGFGAWKKAGHPVADKPSKAKPE